jgi:predicted site-specific integrase-resolvase
VYTAEQAGALLGVNHTTVIRWVEVGLLKGSQLTSGAPWRVQVTAEDKKRLTAADAPQGFLPLKGAAAALGVSQQTILQKLKSGELHGVRVQVGRRIGWRIHVHSTSCDQPDLFEQADA